MNTLRSAAVLMLALACTGCGHVIRGEFAPNHPGKVYDFRHPGCSPAPRPPEPGGDEVLLRYLGAGGLYLEWRGAALLTGPFFSNRNPFIVQFGRLRTDARAVQRGFDGMQLGEVRAILVGHAHYDHLGDVPDVAREYSPQARIYVNQSGANALKGFPVLEGRVVSLQGERADWFRLTDGDGRLLPIRFRAVESAHAPQLWRYHWGAGEIEEEWTEEWGSRKTRALHEGKTFAFVIDLLEGDAAETVRFRIYYQDAAAPAGVGQPAFEAPDAHPYDLAVLCMASFRFVKDHPQSILGRLHPSHVLVTHYEDFFRGPDKPLRFVFPMSSRWANDFLTRVDDTLSGPLAGPQGSICGPSSQAATMPLPGEWLQFQASPR